MPTADFDASDEDATDEAAAQSAPVLETLPDRTVVFGADSRRRIWSGEGAGQARALHVKHVNFLREMIPRHLKLRLVAVATPA